MWNTTEYIKEQIEKIISYTNLFKHNCNNWKEVYSVTECSEIPDKIFIEWKCKWCGKKRFQIIRGR
jgi:CRISPR/Cas system-associated protein Cas10 (large subunit of type III CRISPR-Cas system)